MITLSLIQKNQLQNSTRGSVDRICVLASDQDADPAADRASDQAGREWARAHSCKEGANGPVVGASFSDKHDNKPGFHSEVTP